MVKVCAGDVIAAAAQNTETTQTVFHKLNFPILPPLSALSKATAQLRRAIAGDVEDRVRDPGREGIDA